MADALARRVLLRGLAVSPVAFAVGTVAVPAMAADTEILRLAARVERLARIELALTLRVVDLEDGLEEPPRPKQPLSSFGSGDWSDDGRTFTARFDRDLFGDGKDPRWEAYEVAKTAREAECVRLREAAGLPAIEARREIILDRMTTATEALSAMPCRTVGGLAAKARAWLAIDHGGSRDEWTEDLAMAVIKGAVELGGQAHA